MSRPGFITLPAGKYSFANNDEDLYLPTDNMEEFELKKPVRICVIDTSEAGGKWVGHTLNASENLVVLRRWFMNDKKGSLYYDIGKPVGTELRIMSDI